MIDIDKVRSDTLGLERQIFLNSAGSSLPPLPVVEIVEQYWREESLVGGYAYAKQREEDITAFYDAVARLLSTRPKNVAIAVSATDAYIRALSAIPFAAGDVVLTTDDDYVSNQIHFLSLQKRFGVQVLRGRNLANGDLDLEDFEGLMAKHRPKLVAATHVPTSSGLVQDVEGLGAICKKFDTLYLVDACQSAGQIPLDITRIQCDFLSGTGRKFLRGPRGTGFLFVSDKVLDMGLEPLFPDLQGADWIREEAYLPRPSARRFELWEWQYATILGLTEAIKYAMKIGLSEIHSANQQLLAHVTEGLSSIDGVTQYDRGSGRANIVTFRKGKKSLDETEKHLKQLQVAYSIVDQGSAQIDFRKKRVDWAIRVSPHYFNTIGEMDRFLQIVGEM